MFLQTGPLLAVLLSPNSAFHPLDFSGKGTLFCVCVPPLMVRSLPVGSAPYKALPHQLPSLFSALVWVYPKGQCWWHGVKLIWGFLLVLGPLWRVGPTIVCPLHPQGMWAPSEPRSTGHRFLQRYFSLKPLPHTSTLSSVVDLGDTITLRPERPLRKNQACPSFHHKTALCSLGVKLYCCTVLSLSSLTFTSMMSYRDLDQGELI